MANEPTAQPLKDRRDYYGDYDVVRAGLQLCAPLDAGRGRSDEGAGRGQATHEEKDFSIDSFAWSHDGASIAFSATINPDLIQGVTSDIYVLKLSDDSVKKIVDLARA